MADLTGLQRQLARIAEELDDAALTALREAVDEGRTERPPEEKQLLQARRAVERAIRALDAPRAPAADPVPE